MRSIIALLLLCISASASAVANTDAEIAHLFKYVTESPCVFIRNGKEYPGNEAAEHMKKKYDYFKRRITTAEEFIELSATKSTMSKKQYQIRCQNNDIVTSKSWLTNELNAFRGGQKSTQ